MGARCKFLQWSCQDAIFCPRPDEQSCPVPRWLSCLDSSGDRQNSLQSQGQRSRTGKLAQTWGERSHSNTHFSQHCNVKVGPWTESVEELKIVPWTKIKEGMEMQAFDLDNYVPTQVRSSVAME